MLINLSKFLSSDKISLEINEEFVIDDQEFIEKTHLNNPVTFNGEFFKVEGSTILNAIVSYNYTEECARCLDKFDNKNNVKFEAVVVSNKNYDEPDDTDEIRLIYEDGCVKLDEVIKQMIYLSLPMKAVCKENCKGICPNCGVNLNFEECKCKNELTDPRFNKLKDLLKD